MKCPSCHSGNLGAMKLEESLPAHGCQQCGGALISLLYYREWAERSANDNDSDVDSHYEAREEANIDSNVVLNCPKCKRLMTKYSISGCSKNRLDLCSFCDEAWLDGGEWELLKALHLSKELPSVFTESWQRKVRKEISEKKERERFTKIIGDEDMLKVDEIKSWLTSHKNRVEILFYLNQK